MNASIQLNTKLMKNSRINFIHYSPALIAFSKKTFTNNESL